MEIWQAARLVPLQNAWDAEAKAGFMEESGVYHQNSATGNYSHFGVGS